MEKITNAIEQTLLSPQTTPTDIIKLCQEAKHCKFYAVCVNGCYVSLVKRELRETSVKVVTVIGFPLGAQTLNTKLAEVEDAIQNGADELDMVMNIGWFKAERYEEVEAEIKAIKQKIGNKALKVIVETCLLTDLELKRACRLVMSAGADFIKTSTGFNGEGAKLPQIRLIKMMVGDRLKIKASGGIRNLQLAKLFLENGADRIGTSAGINIAKESSFL